MKTTSFSDMQCSIARTLEHVGSWWSLLIIRDAMMGARRFKHFQENLGIARNTLTKRLGELVEGGILQKVPASDGYAHEEYVLTERGAELAPVLIALGQWGDKWAVHENGPATVMTIRESGEALPRLWPRDKDGAELPLDKIGMRWANGATPSTWTQEKEDTE
ncbi:MAG: helix-turn-helix domain-containing protein [Pseudomonadota bacterium]